MLQNDLIFRFHKPGKLLDDAEESDFRPFLMYLPPVKVCELLLSLDVLLQLVENIHLHVERIKRISCLMQLIHPLAVGKLLDGHGVPQFDQAVGLDMPAMEVVRPRCLSLFDGDEAFEGAEDVLSQEFEVVEFSSALDSV